MINSISRKTIILCLIVGIVLGNLYAAWPALYVDDAGASWTSAASAAVPASERAAGDAVPAAAHLSLWEEDRELWLPFFFRD